MLLLYKAFALANTVLSCIRWGFHEVVQIELARHNSATEKKKVGQDRIVVKLMIGSAV
jgi:hypothetical protein